MITLTIDGKQATVEENTTVLEAAKSIGIKIPTLCYHKELTPNSACRLCTVEVKQGERTRLTASCSLPVEEGMEIQTASERVLAGRKVIMELLAARASEIPEITELAASMGAKSGRLEKRNDDCILCGLCVSVCDEMLGIRAIGFSGRGVTREVTKPFGEEALDCIACGACGFVCPTGAIQMERETIEREEGKKETRYCRYMRMGLIPYAVCPSALECYKCEVDQRMEDTMGTHPAFVARPAKQTDPVDVGGFSVMPERYYTAGHVWAEKIGGHLRVGIDDFAAKLVGPVDAVEMAAEAGAEVKAGEPIWTLKLDNGRSVTMLSPASGKLVAINEDIALDPTLLRKSPYARGWICMIRAADTNAALSELQFKDPQVPHYLRNAPDPVDDWVTEETSKLRKVLKDKGADVSADGPIEANVFEVIPEADWKSVTQSFFGAGQ